MSSLEGKVAIVTGGGRGIGSAIARELSEGGAKVVVNYSNSKGPAQEVVSSLNGNGAVAIQADVAQSEEASRLIEDTISEFGQLDILVNNAGITLDKTMKKLSIEDWDKVVQVDLNSCFYTVKAAIPHFAEQGSGKIVNISSFVGQAGNLGQANYAAAKAGIIGFTKTAAIELAKHNVTVNAVCPGFIATEMFTAVPEEVQEKIVKRIPLGRPGEPDEVARAVRYLVVDGDYITGQMLNINGGIYM